jgi:ferredoxin
MADIRKQVPENAPGDFFVDSTCIDCDACRQIAPSVFGQAASTSFVKSQPETSDKKRNAFHALLSCPTGSIGHIGDEDAKAVMHDFPLEIEHPVYFCGFNSSKSYGGNSYFIRHAKGNWLIDSPKFVMPLVRQFEALGGVSNIFLTHRDDVADAHLFAEHFGSRRIIHRDELVSLPDAECVLDGQGPWDLAPGFVAIWTPGHNATRLLTRRSLAAESERVWARPAPRVCRTALYGGGQRARHRGDMGRKSLRDFGKTQNAEISRSRRFALTGVSAEIRDKFQLPGTNPLREHSLFASES